MLLYTIHKTSIQYEEEEEKEKEKEDNEYILKNKWKNDWTMPEQLLWRGKIL